MKKKIGTAATKIVAGRMVRIVCSNCRVKSNLSLNCGPKARSPDGSNQDVIVRTGYTEYVGRGRKRLNQDRSRAARSNITLLRGNYLDLDERAKGRGRKPDEKKRMRTSQLAREKRGGQPRWFC